MVRMLCGVHYNLQIAYNHQKPCSRMVGWMDRRKEVKLFSGLVTVIKFLNNIQTSTGLVIVLAYFH